MYETNVGAGLPIIKTLGNLLATGDEVIKIEAVLSGTLSYIFNTFSAGIEPFDEIIKRAKEYGYTEPDQRDDLNGMDVARKILILAREIGLPIELSQVTVTQFLPQSCFAAASIEDFFSHLRKENETMNNLRSIAKRESKKLCHIARLENGRAGVSLEFIDNDHPFYSLKGSDNMISFTTKRYRENPLVVRGPGAGAVVTAAGVLSDILSL